MVSITTSQKIYINTICCDLLKKLYLCGVNYNILLRISAILLVVICLKSCIFVVSITTRYKRRRQQFGCDLLKKLYLCGVNYNLFNSLLPLHNVVICLKSCIFVVSITTIALEWSKIFEL